MKRRKQFLATMMSAAMCVAVMPAGVMAESGGEPITLKFFCNEPTLDAKLKEICAEYTRRNPNVEIEVVQVNSADYGTKVDTTILSGEQLDICYFNTTQDYIQRAKQNEFVDLTEFIKAEEGVSSVNDLYWIDTTLDDGGVYGLPGDVKPWFVWLNLDDLEAAGLEVPPLNWTWDDYAEYAKALTWGEGADKHYGSILTTWNHFNILYTYNEIMGDPYFKEDGTLNLDHPAFRKSLEFRHRLEVEDKSSLPLSEQLATSLDYRTAFFNGKCSMTLMGSNIIPQTADLENYPHTFRTTYAAFPSPEGGPENVAYVDNRFYSIGATTINAEEAYKFLRYFTTEGIIEKGVSLAADINSETTMEEVVDRMTAGAPELFDKEQLLKVMDNPDRIDNFWNNATIYSGEIGAAYNSIANRVMMDELSIDEALEMAMKQCQQILDSK